MDLHSWVRRWQIRFVALLLIVFLVWQFDKHVLDPRNENGMTPLMVAANRGDAAEVRRLVSRRNVDKRVPSNDLAVLIAFISWMQSTPKHDVGWTALIYAAQARCKECVQVLLDHGADVNAAGRDSQTALLQAAQNNDRELVELLVARGADPRNPSLIFATLMHPDNLLLRYFLEKGAPPDGLVPGTTLYKSKMTPLLVAVKQKRPDSVRLLLEFHANPEPRDPLNNYSALRIAHREGSTEIEQMLRAAGAKDDGQGEEALLKAMRARDVDGVRAALAAGGDANSKDQTGDPLICDAADKGLTEIVGLLLEHGANIESRNSYGATPLYLAITFKHPETAAFLISKGAAIEDRQHNPLHIAVHTRDFATATLLLDRGADIHAENDAAVRTAAKAADVEMVRFLLERGADPRGVNDSQENALHVAAYRGNRELLEMILDKGVDVNARQYTGQTALFHAAALGNLEGVQTLLRRGADPNIRDEEGKTAADHAVRYPEVQAELRSASPR